MKLTDVLATPTTNYNRYSIFESYDETEISSYTNEGYVFLESMYKDFNSYKRKLYIAVAESEGSQEIITESFSDFFVKLKELIVRFLNFIKTLFSKFILNINRMIRSDKYIRKHKEDLYLFSTDHEFKFNGYKYSIKSNVPAITIVQDLDADFIKVNAATLKEPVDGSNEDSVAVKIKKLNDDLTKRIRAGYYDEIRAKVLGKSDKSKIKEANFSKKLFKEYRSNRSEKEEFNVTSSIVLDCYNVFDNYKEKLETVKETKNDIEEAYEEIKEKLEEMYSTKSTENSMSTIDFLYPTGDTDADLPKTAQLSVSNLNELDSYFKKLSDVITTISTIHTTAFTAKMDALKEEFLQSKAILYRALSKVVKERRKEE